MCLNYNNGHMDCSMLEYDVAILRDEIDLMAVAFITLSKGIPVFL